jgi:hypothetical protein
MESADAARARRAQQRLKALTGGEVVRAGTPKPALYEHLSPIERLDAMAALCRAQWMAAGRRMPTGERSGAPGEIFVIKRG